jgi:hypothetical protein
MFPAVASGIRRLAAAHVVCESQRQTMGGAQWSVRSVLGVLLWAVDVGLLRGCGVWRVGDSPAA